MVKTRVVNFSLVLALILSRLSASAAPAPVQVAATILYVNATVAASGDGLSWEQAYRTLPEALVVTNANPGTVYEIWVAEGVYYPYYGSDSASNRAVSLRIEQNNVQLYGGFAATETLRTHRDWAAHLTVLSGDIDDNDTTVNGVVTATTGITGTNAYHVLWLDGVTYEPITGTTVIDGFTITGGNANSDSPHNAGGGLYCDGRGSGHGCSPTLANITFSGNQAGDYGGGMYNDGSEGGESSPTLTNVIFSGNTADNDGGGMCNYAYFDGASSPTLTNVTFNGNQAQNHGGGMFNDGFSDGESNPTLTNVTFSDNQAGIGGGIYNWASSDGVSSPTLINVTFSGNTALSYGGGMCNFGFYRGVSSPMLTNVTFSGNTAYSNGGGMSNFSVAGESSPTLINVTFSGNTALSYGGGMFSSGGDGVSSPTLTNVTFSGNQASDGGGMYNEGLYSGVSSPTLVNCILWANDGGQIANGGNAVPSVTYSDVQWDGGVYTGTGNLNADPQFVAPSAASSAPTSAGNYRLLPTSPAIDAGDNTAITVATDLDGNPRLMDTPTADTGNGSAPIVDMGAYEAYPPLYVDQDATGVATGLSWTDAFTNVQEALAYTNSHPAGFYEIWVAEGVYYPYYGSDPASNRAVSFRIEWNNVQLYGGFAATETLRTQRDWAAHLTVLSGDIDDNDTTVNGVVTTTAGITGTNAYHVLWLDGVTYELITGTTVIDGFTVTAGRANGTNPHNEGGGLFCNGRSSGRGCSPTLTNVTFSGNRAGYGGGMSSEGHYGGVSSPTLTNVTFSGNRADGEGGGMFNRGYNGGVSSPTLTNVTFNGNLAGNFGGGMCNQGNSGGVSSPTLTNVTFSSNQAKYHGGGMNNRSNSGGESSPTLTNVTFSGNTSDLEGGGMHNRSVSDGVSRPTLINVTFSGNTAQYGGGMYNEGSSGGVSSPTLTDVTFSGNTAQYGGGMYNLGNTGENGPTLADVIFNGNQADTGGGMFIYGNSGLSSPTLINVIFSGNTAYNGGGMYILVGTYDKSSPTLTNVTFSGNQAQYDGGGMYNYVYSGGVSRPTLVNCILWGNDGGPIANSGNAVPSITYSDVQWDSGVYTGTGNLNADPQFVAPIAASSAPTTTGNYRLLPTSPAIDAGNTLSVTVATDLDGAPRVQDGGVDMGAYEKSRRQLIVTLAGNGGGDVTSVPAGLACGDTCAAYFDTNAVITLTATPWLSATFAGWSGGVSGTANPVTLTLASNQVVTATFALNTYTLTPSAGPGGSITPNSVQTVTYGSDFAFTITPETGYHIADVAVDGASVGAVSVYTFTNVMTNHTISAIFALDTYTLTPSSGPGGSIIPSNVQTVTYGSDFAFTIAPEANYHIADVAVDGVSVGAVSIYTFTNVMASHTISATFALDTYTLTPSAGPGGSITPNSVQTVTYGSDFTFTITPGANYHIADVAVDGTSIGTVSVYTFTNVMASHTISAAFTLSCQAISAPAFTFTPPKPLVGETVWFVGSVASGSGPITFTWAWGDGTAAGLGATPSHAFPLTATFQTYTVTLSVSNSCSGPVAVEHAIRVAPHQLFLPLTLRNL